MAGGAPGVGGFLAGPEGCTGGPVFDGATDGETGGVAGGEDGFFRTSGFGCVPSGGAALFLGTDSWPGVPAFGGGSGDVELFAGAFAGAADGAAGVVPGSVPGKEAGFFRTSGLGCATVVPGFGGTDVGDVVLFAGAFAGAADGASGVTIGGVPGREAGFFRTSGLGCATPGGTTVFVGAGDCPAVPAFGDGGEGDATRFAGVGDWPAGACPVAPGFGSLVKSGGLVPGGFSP